MNNVRAEVEDAIYAFMVRVLTKEEQKEIYCGRDIINKLDYYTDAEADVKELAWDLIKNHLNYPIIVEKIKEYVENNYPASEDEEDKDSVEDED